TTVVSSATLLPATRMPTVYLLSACCALVDSGHAAAAPPSSVMNSRRFIALTANPRIMGSIACQPRASQQKRPAHVRFGSKADKAPSLDFVRFTPERWGNRPASL